MLEIRKIRENTEELIERLNLRGGDFSYLHDVVKWDEKRRSMLQEIEKLKRIRNEVSKKIGVLKRTGKPVSEPMATVEKAKSQIAVFEEDIRRIETRIQDALLNTPNVPHSNIPPGQDETDNRLVRNVGEPRTFDFEALPHWDIATALDILDFERAAKIASSRFVVYKGDGARLERALINFMLDLHRDKHGYKEILLPYIVNYDVMVGAGQFPKFVDDAFKLVDERNLYLNPTAEVPGINMHREEILSADDMPISYTAFTTAFRQEAGSAGRDTRGILRQHQFNKVELLKFVTPETSYEENDKMLGHSEAVLKALGLPYRVVELCAGDLGFAMAKTYDIEVWLPSYEGYREIASISNAEDYQARRANIKFRRKRGAKPEFVHTLNGSGLAVGRTLVAILENFQNEDGTVDVPEALKPYMQLEKIK